MRRIIINTLNKLGHQDFVEASNGREGIEPEQGAGGYDDLAPLLPGEFDQVRPIFAIARVNAMYMSALVSFAVNV